MDKIESGLSFNFLCPVLNQNMPNLVSYLETTISY